MMIKIRIRIRKGRRKGPSTCWYQGNLGGPFRPNGEVGPRKRKTPKDHPGGNGKPFFGYAGSRQLDLPWEAFPYLTLGLAGYGDVSIRHQPKEDWRQTWTP